MRRAILLPLLIAAGLLIGRAAAKDAVAFSELPAKPGYVRLYIFRVKQFAGSGVRPSVKIDGVELGKLPNGSSVALYIRPGSHELETKIPIINLPMKGGTVKIQVPETDEFYLRYRTDVQILGVSQYVTSAQYTTGFEVPETAFAKSEITKLKVLPVSPSLLVDAKP